jgi:hypothetical protein
MSELPWARSTNHDAYTLDGTNSAKRPQYSIALAMDHSHTTYILVLPSLQDPDNQHRWLTCPIAFVNTYGCLDSYT